jgi:hypothetical protein
MLDEFFVGLFLERGITMDEIQAMSEVEIQATINSCLDDPGPKPRASPPRPAMLATAHSDFSNGTFSDYQDALAHALENSLDDQLVAPHLRPLPNPEDEIKPDPVRGTLKIQKPQPSTSPNRFQTQPLRSPRKSTSAGRLAVQPAKFAPRPMATRPPVATFPDLAAEIAFLEESAARLAQCQADLDEIELLAQLELDSLDLDDLDAGDDSARESQVLRLNQDSEFDTAIEEAKERDRKAAQKEDAAQRIKREKMGEFTRLLKSLRPEPASGTTLAVMLPDGKRVTRRFDPAEKGMFVYVWVAGQIGGEALPDSLEIKMSVGTVLERERRLNEQGFTGRVLLVATVKDDAALLSPR